MRVNKAKFIRKYLRFYRIVFRIQEPYYIILDGNFIFQALKHKVDIQERLSRLLQDAVIKIFIQQSVLNELQKVGAVVRDALQWAIKYCIVINDSQIEEDTPTAKLVKYISNLNQQHQDSTSRHLHYMVASQDKDLRNELSKIPGTPTIYFNKVSLVLEPPSKASRKYGMNVENSKLSVQSEEREIIESVKTKPKAMTIIGIDATITTTSTATASLASSEQLKPRTKHKATAPNPLSSRPSSKDSKSFKKKIANKFKRS